MPRLPVDLRSSSMLVGMATLAMPTLAVADIYVGTPTSAINVYENDANGDVPAIRVISGASTQLGTPGGLLIDPVGDELYVADFLGQAIHVFDRNADGDVAPLRTITHADLGQVRAVSVNRTDDELYAVTADDRILTLPRPADGNTPAIRTIEGASTSLQNPFGLAYDAETGELFTSTYSAPGGQAGIVVFDATATGNVPPLRSIAGDATSLGTFVNAVAVDHDADEIYAQGMDGSGVLVFGTDASGDQSPSRTIAGPATGFAEIRGLAYDPVGDRVLVVDNAGNGSIRVFPASADGDVAPTAVIAGPATDLAGAIAVAVDELESGGGGTDTGTDTTTGGGTSTGTSSASGGTSGDSGTDTTDSPGDTGSDTQSDGNTGTQSSSDPGAGAGSDGGCGCSTHARGLGSLGMLLPLLAASHRRRRSNRDRTKRA